MTHTQAFSLEEDNWNWLKNTANTYGLNKSTFLNQILRSAKGELSLLAMNKCENNNGNSLAESIVKKQEKIVDRKKEKIERLKQVIRDDINMRKDIPADVYGDIANNLYGIQLNIDELENLVNEVENEQQR